MTLPKTPEFTNQKKSADDIEAGLAQFYGSEQFYKTFTGLKHTEGVEWLASNAGAYWLIDAIGSHWATKRKLRGADFLVVRLELKKDGEYNARLTFHADWDSSNPKKFPSICTQRIHYTDFPLPMIEFYLCNGMLMLKSEY